jgi:DNA replication and repair protein RecF
MLRCGRRRFNSSLRLLAFPAEHGKLPAEQAMVVQHIAIHDFRCFVQARFQPGPGLNLVSAPNASGKSSLLEAVCVLLRLQSPRTSTVGDTVRRDSQGFTLSGQIGDRTLVCHYSAGEGRRLLLDGVVRSRSVDYLDLGLVAFFSNDDMELVRGTSAKRRRYLDFLGSQCDPGYLKNLRAFERALRSRNFLLKEGPHRSRELAAYDGPLVAAGEYLAGVRASLCAELAPLVAQHARAISTREESVGLRYSPSGTPGLAAALAASAVEERRLRQTVVGPHRDDIELHLDGAAAAGFASEGQQRTLALALRLAQAGLIRQRRGKPPVYLVDDVFGELDPERRRRLLAALPDDTQRILTTTSWQWLEPGEEAAQWKIEAGGIRAI